THSPTWWVTRTIYLFITLATFSWLDMIKLSASMLSASPNNTSGMISHILANLTATYTNMCVSINTDSSKWVFNNAGGVMGAMR
ncbi:hypothetical protein V8E52_011722, partial [Russula decolorans]